jgi:eukaryotic-like serine/threonine-protein kinase
METFGKYSLIRKIGTGGMAEVYLARTQVAQGLAKTLVIKTILPGYGRSRHFVSMFIDEAKIALGLNHPNIAQVFDFGAVGDIYYLAMEQVEGLDLLALLQDAAKVKRRLPYGISAYIAQQIAKGLDYAHRKADDYGQPLGIVHRDISPQNVLLSWDGAVKIVDFGIARARHVHEEDGVIKGKFAYMSPEQARGEPVDCRSDVFALGIVLYEMVCARPLFHGKGKDALEMVKAGHIPRPRDFAPELPETLERIMLKALAFGRTARYATARDFQHDLVRFQLEWAQKTGSLVDSGALASLLAQLVPPDERIVHSARPPAEAELGHDDGHGGHLGHDSHDSHGLHTHTPGPVHTPSPTHGGGDTPSGTSGTSGTSGPPIAGGSLSGAALDARRAGTAPPHEVTKADGPETLHARRDQVRERRHVYVLQALLRGTEPLHDRIGPDGLAALLSQFQQVARDVAFKHEAILEVQRAVPAATEEQPSLQPSLRMVVGLPIAGEDDAGRAIRLALALLDALDGITADAAPELQLALAIQRGVAVVARRRDRQRTISFELEGATAAFTQRLAQQAKDGDVLVGGRVFRSARAEWNFEALPAMDLPIDDQIATTGETAADDETDPGVRRARVYRLCGPKERAQRLKERQRPEGRLHGRELQLKALRDLFRDIVVNRKKRQVLLVGDAGVGKRTLVRTFLEGVTTRDALVVRTLARVGTSMTPYGIIADMARDVLGLAEDAASHEVERRLLRATSALYTTEESQAEHRTVLQVLGRLLGVAAVGNAPVQDMDPAARRAALIQVMSRVERQLPPDRPLLIIAEDVHWVDQDSQELFAALLKVASARAVLGIMTSRPEPRVLRLAKELRMQPIFLEELPEEPRRQLLNERFAPGQDIDALAEEIFARAGGNPFFVNEILDSLLERGIVAADGEDGEHPGLLRWVRRDAPIHVPSTIEDLLIARIDRLSPIKKETLLHAAVLGRNVSAAALSALLGRPVRLELDELVRHGFLASRDGEYRFKNDMTMTVSYGLLPVEVRVEMHRAAASRIADSPSYRPGQDDALVARHLELAGDAELAAARYTRAATHAIDLGGNADAFRQLERALKLLPESAHGRRFETHRLREELLRRVARRPQQLRELHALRREGELLGEPDKLALAHSLLAQFYIDVGKAPAAARAVAPALEMAQRSGDKLAEAEALRLRSAISRLVGNAEESLQLAERALALCAEVAEKSPVPPPACLTARATILMSHGTTLWNIGRLEQAIESYAEALVIYRALAMPRQEARALNNMGIVFAALGEYEEALSHYKSALKIDQDVGDRSAVALKLANIGQCYADLGDTARADSYLSKALMMAQHTGDLSAAADATVSLGQVRLRQGDAAAALVLFERGLALATENRERYQEIRALQYIALAQLGGEDTTESAETALELARSSIELSRKVPMAVGVIYGLTFQALALSRLGRHVEAVHASDEAAALVGANSSRPEGLELLLRWRAQVLRVAGQEAGARAADALASEEIAAKASRIRDVALRKLYTASRPPAGGT